MPEGHVNLPGGLKLKKNVAIGIGIAAVAVAGFYYYKQRQSAQASTSTTTDQTAADQNIDPQTGYAYGSPEDQAALAAMQGAGYGAGYSTYGQGYYLGGPPTGPNPTPQTQGFTSNAEWTQAAEQYMGSTGSDAIAASLGHYIVGSPLSSDEVTIVQEAIAAEGYPPVPGPNGFPPSYKTGSGQKPPPPPPNKQAHNPVKGIKATARFTQIDVSWDKTANAQDYLVKARLGSKVVAQATVKAGNEKTTLHDLKPKTEYKISVWAQPGTGGEGSVRVKTH